MSIIIRERILCTYVFITTAGCHLNLIKFAHVRLKIRSGLKTLTVTIVARK